MFRSFAQTLFLLGWLCLGAPFQSAAEPLPCPDLVPTADDVELDDVTKWIRSAERRLKAQDLEGRTLFRFTAPPTTKTSDLCVIFLTTGGDHRAFTTLGRGPSIDDALAHAVAQQRLRPRRSFALIRLDVVTEQVIDTNRRGPESPLGSALIGLATSERFEGALHPEEIAAYRLAQPDGSLHPERLRTFLHRFPHRFPHRPTDDLTGGGTEALPSPAPPRFPLLFRTRSFSRQPGKRGKSTAYELVRGRPSEDLWRRAGYSALEDKAAEAGRYLVRHLSPEGRFGYNYLAAADRFTNAYHLSHHSEALIALFALHRARPQEQFLKAGELALGYLRRHLRPCPKIPEALCLIEGKEITLGGTSSALLAILEHPYLDSRQDLMDEAGKIAYGLLQRQTETGEFTPHKVSWPAGLPDSLVSPLFPYQANLALAKMARQTQIARWRWRALLGLEFLLQSDPAQARRPSHELWIAKILESLDGAGSPHSDLLEELRAAGAEKIARSAAAQLREGPTLTSSDWRGGFFSPPRTTATADRIRLLATTAHWLGSADLSPEQISELQETLCGATDFLVRTQFQQDSTLFLADPQRAEGGFRAGLTDFQLRIDTTSRAASALLDIARLLRQGPWQCPAPGATR